MKYHPDKNPGSKTAEQKFKEIAEAKEVLTNADNRQKYDMLGANWKKYQHMGGNPRNYSPGGAGGQQDMNNVFASFFEEIFGDRNARKRGRNFEANVKIAFKEAYTGLRDVLTYEGKKLRIHLKPGIKNNQVLRLKGQGGTGRNGGPNGDLHLKVMVNPDLRFLRKENDLYTDVKVDLYKAVLGEKISVPSMKGNKLVSIPVGTQSGEKLKLKGLGMPLYEDPTRFGNLYVTINIVIPKRLSEEERKLFEQLAALRKT
ncbi:UNVERIFIED_CONTAM: hypothetical protein GTU68_018223 [Idotea baltica]|nr:hypothetical protein [Idotea baltica]